MDPSCKSWPRTRLEDCSQTCLGQRSQKQKRLSLGRLPTSRALTRRTNSSLQFCNGMLIPASLAKDCHMKQTTSRRRIWMWSSWAFKDIDLPQIRVLAFGWTPEELRGVREGRMWGVGWGDCQLRTGNNFTACMIGMQTMFIKPIKP